MLILQDIFTAEYFILVPVQDANAKAVAKTILEKLIRYFGPPISISRLLAEFAEIFGISKYCSTVMHPQSQGEVERQNSTFEEYIKIYIQDNPLCETNLPLVQTAYNAETHESIRFSPHEVLFGKIARTPFERRIGNL